MTPRQFARKTNPIAVLRRNPVMKTNSALGPALLLILTLAFAAAPAITPPFMGYLPGQMPVDIGRAAIQPAGYAFSIWGLIYLWLIAHAGFGLSVRRFDAVWSRPRLALIGAVVLGTVWLAIAARSPIGATVTITVMAGCAIAAFLMAEAEQDRWILIAPLAIFAGWLTAATLVSIGVVLAGFGVLSNEASAYAMLGLAVVLGLYLQSLQPSMPVYGATLVWALVAVYQVNRVELPIVAMTAALAAAATALGTAALCWRARSR
jgi:hypothetical protein